MPTTIQGIVKAQGNAYYGYVCVSSSNGSKCNCFFTEHNYAVLDNAKADVEKAVKDTVSLLSFLGIAYIVEPIRVYVVEWL